MVRYEPPQHGVDDLKAGPRYGGGGAGGMRAERPIGLRGWRRERACISAMMRCWCHEM